VDLAASRSNVTASVFSQNSERYISNLIWTKQLCLSLSFFLLTQSVSLSSNLHVLTVVASVVILPPSQFCTYI
jgi:hypothetical protein